MRCKCLTEGDLTGLLMRQIMTEGNCFIECTACSRRLGVSGRLETNEFFRRGARLTSLNESLDGRTDPEALRRRRESELAGIHAEAQPVPIGSLSEDQRQQRRLLGLRDEMTSGDQPPLSESQCRQRALLGLQETTVDTARTPRCTCPLAVLRQGGVEQLKNGDLSCRTCHGLLDPFSAGVLALQGVKLTPASERGQGVPAAAVSGAAK